MLVRTVVQITLDRAAVGIRGQDEPLSCCAQLLDLDPQSIELLLHVDLPALQIDRPPSPDCQELSVIATAASSGQHPSGREGSPLRTGLRPP